MRVESEWCDRLKVAQGAVCSAGKWLLSVRGTEGCCREAPNGQIKTSFDEKAERIVLGAVGEAYPADRVLSEEQHEASGCAWDAPGAFWVVDALDGTRSYVGGYDGFCVQVAYVSGGDVVLGVVFEPVAGTLYTALLGHGAYMQRRGGSESRLRANPCADWPLAPVFVDSTFPGGVVGELMREHSGVFLECGSIGLKICRVAEAKAHCFAKAIPFKLWDTAPGDLILKESGGKLGLWDGTPIPYGTGQVYFENLLAAAGGLYAGLSEGLSGRQSGST